MRNLLTLENVHKTYHVGEVDVHALRGVDLKVRQGEFLAILGESGSGKSTMLNSIGCLDVPSKGKIHLANKNIQSLDESNLAQIRGRKIGFVFQNYNLIPSLTALENVTLPMIFQNVEESKRKARATELLNLVGLGHRMSHTPMKLSGGEQQRVAIARALSNDPEIILADEPTGNLDSETELDIINLLVKLHEKRKKTIIMITHNRKIAKYAERIINLKDGKISK
tara:strand:+ start:2094 stop:2768 length:675 start_codon:yes stop_codon:yes gene_type:complete